MADTNTTCTIMLFESGALCALLPAHSQGQALARKIEDAYGDAIAAENLAFDLVLNPFEVGMAFGAASNGNSLLSQAVAGKLQAALKAKLEELGVSYGGSHPQQQGELGAEPQADGDAGQPAGDDAPADSNANDDGGQDAL